MVTRDNFNFTAEVSDLYEFFRKKLTKWNDNLYSEAEQDKNVYEALSSSGTDVTVNKLKQAGVVKFKKERFRLNKNNVQPEVLKKALSDKGYKVTTKSNAKKKDDALLEVNKAKGTITIFNEHPAFKEKMIFRGDCYIASYGRWNYTNSKNPICKLKTNNQVVFNKSHPLLKSTRYLEAAKKLGLGLLLLAKECNDFSPDLLMKLSEIVTDALGE